MSTYRELVYICIDELKLNSDDANYTEDDIMFLLDKYRAFLLKQKYADIRKQIPESNFQTICFNLKEVPAISGEPCEGGSYLRSDITIPALMKISNPRVYPIDYYQGEITYISRDRMRYIGHNRYLKNIIYTSLGPDNYLYFKSSNPQFLYLERACVSGIFEDALKAADLQEKKEGLCDAMDSEFPIEEALVAPMIEMVVKELSRGLYNPSDDENNAADDLSNLNVKK